MNEKEKGLPKFEKNNINEIPIHTISLFFGLGNQ